MELQHIPLDQLKVSPLNMRHARKAPDVSDILPSIRARGVQQPLLVRKNGKGYEIVAGRRRFFSLKQIAKEGGEPGPVPCAVMADGDDAAALEASLIENTARLDPDEVARWETFARLVKEGRTVEDIAVTFGVTEIMVKRALALGELLPNIREAYRNDDIDAQTVHQLTLASAEQQGEWLKLFQDPEQYAPRGWQLKQWLFGGEISTKTALFPLGAYTGRIVTDLFSETGYFGDLEQFWILQNAAIAAKRDALVESGWSDVVVLDVGERFHKWEHVATSKKDGGRVYIEVRETGEVTCHQGFVTAKEHQRHLRKAADGDEKIGGSGRLLTEVRRSLLTFSDRERDVLIRRLGFETSPETLQEVADDYGITRERIRQIEARATKKWIRESSWDDVLEQKISRLLIGRSFPLPVAGVEAIDVWFEGVSGHRVFFRNLVQTICGDRIHMVPIDGLYYFSLMTQETWDRTVSEASALLSSGAGREWSEDYARSLVHGLLPDTAKEFGSLLWDKASHFCHFSVAEDGSRILTSYGRGADQLVEAILAESDTPLHYTEIAERARIRDGRSLDVRRAHSAAANIGFLFARGTYGLTRHVPLSDEQMSQVRSEAEDIVCSEAPGRQWHSSEILSEISERMGGGFDGLDKYVLDIALTGSETLRPLGKMAWVAAAASTGDQSRIDVHQAVVAIVQAAGHPLSTGEIKERLTAVRGVAKEWRRS